jgi:hypothetical protein
MWNNHSRKEAQTGGKTRLWLQSLHRISLLRLLRRFAAIPARNFCLPPVFQAVY